MKHYLFGSSKFENFKLEYKLMDNVYVCGLKLG